MSNTFAHLPTLQELQQTRRAVPKYAMKTRLDHKAAKDKDADRAWEACKRLVDIRDRGKCRVCGHNVVRTLALNPKRGEHHHLVKRREQALALDPRNIVLVHLACHEKLERHTLEPVQKDILKFDIAGVLYVNADYLIDFQKAAV